MSTPLLVSIQVGLPRWHGHPGADDPMDRPWESGFFKQAVDGPRWLGRTNLAGDGQADLVNHGGPDKAVLCYAASHYPAWRAELDRPDLPHGAFGENFTIEGLTEETVHLGDTYRLGDAIVQVSQPRQPCWKMGRRWQIVDLPKQVIANGRSGWYLRVLQAGELAAGTPIELVSRPRPTWTIARASKLLYHEPDNVADMEDLANLPELSRAWREELLERIARRAK